MIDPFKSTIDVEISNLVVSHNDFHFNYIISVNGKPNKIEKYQDKHDWGNNLLELETYLKKFGAVKIALRRF